MKKKFIALLLSGALLVSAAVWPASAASVEQFTDVDSSDWFYTHVDYVAENGLLNGTSQTTFGPEASMTRGMFVTVLGNMTGIDTGLYPGTRFDDVLASEYYASRINWATENGIVSGLGGGKFGPENSVTREQAATMLYNYAKRTGNDTSYSSSVYNSFPDTSAVSSYAVEPLKWATSQGIINGSDGKLNPQGTATRAQIAAILHNAEKVLVKTELLPTPEPTATPVPTATPAPTATPSPTATPRPTVRPTPTPSTPASNIVYWTPSGKAYHRPTCPTIDNSKNLIRGTIAEAIASGRSACKVCKP